MRRPGSWLAVLILVGTGVGCTSSHHTVPQATARASTPAQTAHELAQTMLGAATLPVGARPYDGPLPTILMTASAGTPAVDNLVDEHRAWTVQEPAATLRGFKFATPKNGFAPQGGAGSVETPAGKAWTFESDFLRLPLNVGLAQLNIATADRVGGGAVVRVDALVSWTPPKPAAEYVPAADRVATLTAMHPTSPPSMFRREVITDPRRYAVLVASFDRLRLAVMVKFGECGPSEVFVPDLGGYAGGSGTIDEVTFSTDTRTKPDLIAVLQTCHGVGVRAHGMLEPTLGFDQGFYGSVKDQLTPHA